MIIVLFSVTTVIVSIILLLPIVVFCAQVWFAIASRSRGHAPISSETPNVSVLVPAHNEEASVGRVIQEIRNQLTESDRIVVVADNCDDQTAVVAEDAGAEVVVRSDETQLGKSHALAYGLSHLSAIPPDVVIVIDADCTIKPNAIRRLSATAFARQRPVQASYTFDNGDGFDTKRVVSSFAIFFKNHIRPLGLSFLGMPCQLTGCGMAFPWSTLQHVQVDNTALTEDTQLGIDLVLAGHPPLFCPMAEVVGTVPKNWSTHLGQRRRWEHGYLVTIFTQTPQLLISAVRQMRLAPLWAAIDLTIPPLALLSLLWSVATCLAIVSAFIASTWLPLILQSCGGALMLTTVFAGWLTFCRDQVPFLAILSAPWYVLRKLPLYGGFLWNRQTVWLRTDRD